MLNRLGFPIAILTSQKDNFDALSRQIVVPSVHGTSMTGNGQNPGTLVRALCDDAPTCWDTQDAYSSRATQT